MILKKVIINFSVVLAYIIDYHIILGVKTPSAFPDGEQIVNKPYTRIEQTPGFGMCIGSNCTMNDGQLTYCEKGCCEHQDYKYCCPLNATTIAEIIVGSAIGVGVLIFAIGVCIICSRRKLNSSASPSIFDVNADYQRLMEREGNDSNFPNTYM